VSEHAAIEARGLSRAFGSLTAVDGASLRVERGQLVALLGPSGSGKTTLLRMIAGFERPDAGTVAVGGRTVAGPGTWVEPEARRIGMVFQQGALFPHLDVARNVGFGAARPERVGESLELVGLVRLEDGVHIDRAGREQARIEADRHLLYARAIDAVRGEHREVIRRLVHLEADQLALEVLRRAYFRRLLHGECALPALAQKGERHDGQPLGAAQDHRIGVAGGDVDGALEE